MFIIQKFGSLAFLHHDTIRIVLSEFLLAVWCLRLIFLRCFVARAIAVAAAKKDYIIQAPKLETLLLLRRIVQVRSITKHK